MNLPNYRVPPPPGYKHTSNKKQVVVNNQWYYVDRFGTSKGPCGTDELASLYLRREVYDQTYIWNGIDILQWTPLFQVPLAYASIQAKIKNQGKSENRSSGNSESLRPLPPLHQRTHSVDHLPKKYEKTEKSDDGMKDSNYMEMRNARARDKKDRRKRTQTLAFVATPPMSDDTPPSKRDKKAERLKVPVQDSLSSSSSNTYPKSSYTLESQDPKQQELERENIECKARLRGELTKVMGDLEIKFREFEMRLDRCMAKQSLRVQKHRQVIQVYQTQNQIHQLEEENENNRELDEQKFEIPTQEEEDINRSDSDSGGSGSGSGSGGRNVNGSIDKKRTKKIQKPHINKRSSAKDQNSRAMIEAKIASEQKTIEKISMLKEYDKFLQKINILKNTINSL